MTTWRLLPWYTQLLTTNINSNNSYNRKMNLPWDDTQHSEGDKNTAVVYTTLHYTGKQPLEVRNKHTYSQQQQQPGRETAFPRKRLCWMSPLLSDKTFTQSKTLQTHTWTLHVLHPLSETSRHIISCVFPLCTRTHCSFAYVLTTVLMVSIYKEINTITIKYFNNMNIMFWIL